MSFKVAFTSTGKIKAVDLAMYANAGNSVDVSRKVGAEFLESSKAIKVA